MRTLLIRKLCIFGIAKNEKFSLKIIGTSSPDYKLPSTISIPKGYEISTNRTYYIAQSSEQTDYLMLNYQLSDQYDVKLELKAIIGVAVLSCQIYKDKIYTEVYSKQFFPNDKIEVSVKKDANCTQICRIRTMKNNSLIEVYFYKNVTHTKKINYLKIYIIVSALFILIGLIALKVAFRCRKKVMAKKQVDEKKIVEMNYCDASKFFENVQLEERKVLYLSAH